MSRRYQFELSPREAQVMRLLGRGLTHRQVAEVVGVKVDMVSKYKIRAIDKCIAHDQRKALEAWNELHKEE